MVTGNTIYKSTLVTNTIKKIKEIHEQIKNNIIWKINSDFFFICHLITNFVKSYFLGVPIFYEVLVV